MAHTATTWRASGVAHPARRRDRLRWRAVKDSLAVGLTGTATHTVAAEMSPPHLPVVVLSTPDMIRLIEQTCLEGMIDHLDDGETTVGTHVCVSHVAAATEGEQVEVSYTLAELERSAASPST